MLFSFASHLLLLQTSTPNNNNQTPSPCVSRIPLSLLFGRGTITSIPVFRSGLICWPFHHTIHTIPRHHSYNKRFGTSKGIMPCALLACVHPSVPRDPPSPLCPSMPAGVWVPCHLPPCCVVSAGGGIHLFLFWSILGEQAVAGHHQNESHPAVHIAAHHDSTIRSCEQSRAHLPPLAAVGLLPRGPLPREPLLPEGHLTCVCIYMCVGERMRERLLLIWEKSRGFRLNEEAGG